MDHIMITISREYGSGGRLIGQQVAEKLGIAFYNRNLIDMVAHKSGLSKDYINQWEETRSSRFIWRSLPANSLRFPLKIDKKIGRIKYPTSVVFLSGLILRL